MALNNKSHQQEEIELHKSLIKDYRKRYSPEYSMVFQRYWNRAIIDELGGNNNGRVLDFGCGTGVMIQDLSRKYKSILGLDISFEMIKEIKESNGRHANTVFVVGDGERLPLSENIFDTVVCRSSLHHLPSLDNALSEICRVIKSGGILVLSEPSNDSLLIRTVRKIMYKKSSKFSEEDEGYISKELLNRLVKHGFRVKKMKRFGFLSYVFAGFPDKISFLERVPFNKAITHLLIFADKLLSHIPFVNTYSLHIIIKAQKI